MKDRNSLSTRRSFIVLSICVSLFLVSGCARKSNQSTKITVGGQAVARVEPDSAVLVISVITQNAQALAAQQENARKSEAVANAVKTTAGSNVEIKTSDYTLQPQYDNRDNNLPKIIGYNARNSIIVTIGDLKNVGAAIDAASRAGANSIDSIAFVLRQTSPARGQALADATQQAMIKARSIAQALGGHVSRVVEENEGSTVASEPRMEYDSATMGKPRQATTPIVAGQLSISSNVQLIVEIEG
ncbi:MAG: SIMPL domain-containing protein [Pyrinomonadaceae bacterium]